MECRLAGEIEILGENLPQRHFCPSQHPTWPDSGLNPGRRGGKPNDTLLGNLEQRWGNNIKPLFLRTDHYNELVKLSYFQVWKELFFSSVLISYHQLAHCHWKDRGNFQRKSCQSINEFPCLVSFHAMRIALELTALQRKELIFLIKHFASVK
jgi:hypothetical protein